MVQSLCSMAVYLLRQPRCCFSLKLTICIWLSFYILGSFSLLIINTTNFFNYTYLDDYEIYVRDIKSIVFMVKAPNDAHIALSETLYMHTEKSYEVVIGGWGNQRSVIRKCDQCLPKSSLYHHAPLSDKEYRPFWITWEGGLIRLGNGTVPGEEELIDWEDPEPYRVNHMGVSTGWGASGSWVLDFPPPIWLAWSAWSQCNSTCGFSIRHRMRSCTDDQPIYDISCWGSSVETLSCDVPNCPIDGSWSSWASWTTCSRTCSVGVQSRERRCDSPVPQFGGDICPGDYTQMRRCDYGPCPVNGSWSTWTHWTLCTLTCGGGTQGRFRVCNNPATQFGGQNCSGNTTELRACSTEQCPVNGGWSDWSAWITCSTTCEGGTQTRSRHCDNPTPQFGGQYCSGKNMTSQSCGEINCPVHGGWSPWLQWSSCSVSCGGGTQKRLRVCDNPVPLYGGMNCSGADRESQICEHQSCAVDGLWSSWGTWAECSTSCGRGSQSRSRDCDNPEPQNGGNYCDGNELVYRTCSITPCPVAGAWSKWTSWSDCSSTCGEGIELRERDCNNPPPQHGGSDCPGSDTDRRDCFLRECQIDGGWSSWQEWAGCSSTCGWSVQTRSRTCDNPIPQFDGEDCPGKIQDTKNCIVQRCPVDGVWAPWTEWTPCSSTCSYGSRERLRNCSDPSPDFGGADCIGLRSDTKTCYDRECPQDGGWTKWTLWSSCTLTCGGGHRERVRFCTAPSPRYDGSYCQGNGTYVQPCNIMDCPEIVALIAEQEIKPVEAPGAVSIGMIGLAFCGVLLAFVIVLDLATISRHFSYMKRNVRYFKDRVWTHRGRQLHYEDRLSSMVSGNNTTINVSIEENQIEITSNHCTASSTLVENESESTDHKNTTGKHLTTATESTVITHEDIVVEPYPTYKKNMGLNNIHKRQQSYGTGSTKL